MTSPWMLDELAHAGPEHLGQDFVAGYERKQGYPDPAEDLAVLAAAASDLPLPAVRDRGGVRPVAGGRRRRSGLGYASAGFAEHIRTEHNTFRWMLEPMPAAAGFQILTVEFSGSVCGAYTRQKR